MDELKNIAPNLSKIKKENPFRIPDNYFEDFSARLQIKLDAENAENNKKENRIIRLVKPALGLAAGFALIFMLAYWPMTTFTNKQLAKNQNSETETNEMLYASMVEGIDLNSFYTLLDEPNGAEQFDADDLADFVFTYSSEYEIFSETEN